jgi:hypothetical protein
MATMVPSLQHCRIQQLANMLRDKSVIKTREYYCFTMYLLAILRHNALSMRRASVFAGCVSGRRCEYHTLSGRS